MAMAVLLSFKPIPSQLIAKEYRYHQQNNILRI